MDIKVGSVTGSSILKDDLHKQNTMVRKATKPGNTKGVSWEEHQQFKQEVKEPNWLERILRDFNDILSLFDIHLHLSTEKAEEIQVKIVNTETGETIKKVPP